MVEHIRQFFGTWALLSVESWNWTSSSEQESIEKECRDDSTVEPFSDLNLQSDKHCKA